MSVLESVRMAFRSLAANKMRSFLTTLGIIIGTGAVIALLSVGEGARLAITSQIQGIGSNLLIVFPGRLTQGMPSAGASDVPLTRADAQALTDPALVPHVSAVAPIVSGSASVTYGAESMGVQIEGTTPDYELVRNYPAQYGRFISTGDEAVSARVAVIGTDVADRLFGDRISAVGLTIRLNTVPFQVVGVLEEKGGQGMGGVSADRIVIIPLSTAHTRLFPGRFVSQGERTVDIIYASVVDEDSIDVAIDEITQVLRQRQGNTVGDDDGFTVTSQQEVLGVFDQVTSILTTFLVAIAGISLLVGGIGIMNIMLVSVTERTREIGIRKAVGARSGDVLLQFLIESIVLSVAGGLLGIGFGWGVSRLVNRLGSFTAVVSMQSVALAVGFSLAVGLFFGIYPARRAARMNPIDALRYE
ncbi:MAG: ABC transporter permease [Anaerolineae bacterium]